MSPPRTWTRKAAARWPPTSWRRPGAAPPCSSPTTSTASTRSRRSSSSTGGGWPVPPDVAVQSPGGVMPCGRSLRCAGSTTRQEDDMSDRVDALVIFGATGDLAKLETFPALVGLVERDVLNVPVIGVSKRGWDLEQFRDYAVASLKLNNMDPASPSATKMLSLLRYVDGDLD